MVLAKKIVHTIKDHYLGKKISKWSKNAQGTHQMKHSEVAALVKLIRDTNPRTVVEIGSFNGVTSTILASAIHHFKKDCKLLCIDPFNSQSSMDYYNERVSKKHLGYVYEDNFDGNTKALSDIVVKIKGYSDKVELPEGLSIDILFIDGDHSKDGVIKDIVRYAPLVPVGKFICFHDFSIGRSGTIGALLDTIWPAENFHNYRWVSQDESLLVIRKLKEAPITVSESSAHS